MAWLRRSAVLHARLMLAAMGCDALLSDTPPPPAASPTRTQDPDHGAWLIGTFGVE